jgi:pantetheine-phosphate adenylyltransferase
MSDAERLVIVGGTFTPVHSGHRALLHKSFQTASHDGPGDGRVLVGLTSDELARETRSDPTHADALGTVDERRERLAAEVDALAGAYTADHEILELTDPDGPGADRADVDAVVVSPEGVAQRRARELNRRRRERGLAPLEIHTPPFVVAADGVRISSTRIRNGEIDADGRLLGDGTDEKP